MPLNNTTSSNQSYGMAQQAIINGNFDRSDRGSSFTNPVGNQYTVERWKVGLNPLSGALPANIIHSKQPLTPGDIQSSFNYYRINVDGAGTGSYRYLINQPIENGTRFLCGLNKRVPVSFYARSSIVGKRIGISANQTYGTTGSPSTAEILNGTFFTLTSSWVRYSFVFPTNTLVGKTFGTSNDDSLSLVFGLAWDSVTQANYGASSDETFVGAGNIEIAQVRLNSDDTASLFQPKYVSDEIRDCQRFATIYSDANTTFPIGDGSAISTTQARIHVELPQQMRIAPTLVATATDWQLTDGVTATDLTAISIQSSSNKTITLLCTVASGLTQFRPYQLVADGTANRMMIFDAEL